MGVEGDPAARAQKSQVPIKSARPFCGPRIAGEKTTDIRLFLNAIHAGSGRTLEDNLKGLLVSILFYHAATNDDLSVQILLGCRPWEFNYLSIFPLPLFPCRIEVELPNYLYLWQGWLERVFFKTYQLNFPERQIANYIPFTPVLCLRE